MGGLKVQWPGPRLHRGRLGWVGIRFSPAAVAVGPWPRTTPDPDKYPFFNIWPPEAFTMTLRLFPQGPPRTPEELRFELRNAALLSSGFLPRTIPDPK